MGMVSPGLANCLRYDGDNCIICEGVMIMHVCTNKVSECPDGYQSQPEIVQLFDASATGNLFCLRSPEVFSSYNYKTYYVDSSWPPLSTGSGTLYDPFNSIYFAFTKVYATFTQIILSAGDYLYQIDYPLATPLVKDKYNPLRINSFLDFYELWIIGDPDFSTVVYWTEKLMISPQAHKTYIQNILFRGDYILRNNCTGETAFCYYCPSLTFYDNAIYTDQGYQLTLDEYYQIPTNCSAYSDHILFSFSYPAFFESVALINFRQQFDSLIFSNASLSLHHVYLEALQARAGGSVITLECTSDCYNSNFIYSSGSVCYLNPGYEHTNTIQVGSFFTSNSFNSTYFEHINFIYNFVLCCKNCPYQAHLISVSNSLGVTVISSINFEAIYANSLIIVDQSDLVYTNLQPGYLNISHAYSQIHFQAVDIVLLYVYTSTHCISVLMDRTLQNIYINTIIVVFGLSGTNGFINIANLGTVSNKDIYGEQVVVTIDTGPIAIMVPPRTLHILAFELFCGYTGFDTIAIIGMPNIHIEAIELLYLQDGGLSTVGQVIDVFSSSGMYFSLLPNPEEISNLYCKGFVFITDAYSVVIQGITVYYSYCQSDPEAGGVIVDTVAADCTISQVTMFEIFSQSNIANTLYLQNIDGILALDSIELVGVYNYIGAAVNIASVNIVNITNIQILGAFNDFDSPILINESINISISNFLFLGLKTGGYYGGCLSVTTSRFQSTYFSLTNGTIEEVFSLGSIGGGLCIEGDTNNYQSTIIVSSVTFLGIFATDGAAIYLSDSLWLTDDSIIENVNITGCYAVPGGILSDYHYTGLLTISQVRIYDSIAAVNAIFIGSYLSHRKAEFRLRVSDLEITGGESRYPAISLTGLSRDYVFMDLTRVTIHDISNTTNGLADGMVMTAATCNLFELTIFNMSQALKITSSATVVISNGDFTSLTESFAVMSDSVNFACVNCEISFINQSVIAANSISSVNLTNCDIHDNNPLLSTTPLISIADNTQTVSSFVNCTFNDNIAQAADIFHFTNTLITIEYCTISRNLAIAYDYSGIYAFATQVNIISSEFTDQTSNKLGAFLYAIGNSTVSITSTTFTEGYANNGGALYIDSSNASIYSCTFNQGQASIGGSIYISGSTLLVNSSNFLENTALTLGGSIYALNTHVTVINSTFARGYSLLGVGLYMDSSESLYISDSKFIGCKSSSINYTAAVYIETNASVSVENSSFAFPQNKVSGIMVNGASAVNITDCMFQNTSSIGYGAISCLGGQVGGNLTVLRSKIIDNYSTGNGAGLYLQDLGLVMSDSLISGNIAEMSGGGIYLASPNCKNCSFNIVGHTNITYNSCTYEGGGIKWLDYKPNIDSQVIIKNNTAAYGGDLASVPCSLKAYSRRALDNSADFIIFEAAPGQNFTRGFNVSLYDTYGNVVATDSTSTIALQTIESYPDLSLRGITTFTATQGVFWISLFIPDGPPGSVQRFSALTSTISSTGVANDNAAYSNSVIIELFLRNCTYGEQISGSQCVPCKELTYLIDPGYICNNCPDGAICPGSAWILPMPGYWRSSNFSEIVYQCPIEKSCLGNTTRFDFQGGCSLEYDGIMCNTCKAGYTKAADGTCLVCPSQAFRTIETIFICTILLITGIILVKASVKAAFFPKSLFSIYIKILTNYLQLMFLTAQFEFNWPSYVLQLLSSQKLVITSADSIFSIDCYLASSTNSATDSYYYKLILLSIMPLIVFAVAFVIWLGICLTKETWSYLKRELLLTMIIGFFLVYPNISIACFSHFSCLNIDKLGSYLKGNYAIECSGERYTQFYSIVVIPSIMVWIVGLPAIILAIMIKRKRFLHQDQNRVLFGFLFNGYKKATFFWEFVIMYRKILMISIATFFSSISASVQALSIFLLLNLSVFLHFKLTPYVLRELNNMEMEALITSAVTLYCGMYYLTQDITGPFQIVLFILIVVGNGYFVLNWAYWMTLAMLDILVKYFPSLKYSLKKGDAYDEEFYQEKLSRPGSYFENREGERLYTFMRYFNKEQGAPSIEIENMDQLYKNTVAYEYIERKGIALADLKKIPLETVIEEEKGNEEIMKFAEFKDLTEYSTDKIRNTSLQMGDHIENHPQEKESIKNRSINELVEIPTTYQRHLILKRYSNPLFDVEDNNEFR